MTMSASVSPKWRILPFRLRASVSACSSTSSRFSPRTFANVSMTANVASVARRHFRTVASMYSPFSVNAL